MSHWYLIQSKPRQEAKAYQELVNQGYRAFLPTMQVETFSLGKRVKQAVPLFSRYLFIQLNDTSDNWAPIRSTKGVSQLVRFAGKPAYLNQAQFDLLQAALQLKPIETLFKVGASYDVSAGPFKNLSVELENILTSPDGEERAMVLLDVLGKVQRLNMDLSLLRLAA